MELDVLLIMGPGVSLSETSKNAHDEICVEDIGDLGDFVYKSHALFNVKGGVFK